MRGLVLGIMGAFALGAAAQAQGQDPGPGGPIQYDVSFENARHHEARVTAVWREVPPGPFKLMMARSSPGRYALHEFAKNVYSLSAVDGAGRPLKVERTDPYSWTVVGHDGTVKVTYTLYADHGDGTYAQVDITHAHLNMPATFLWAQGYDARPIRVRFHPFAPDWKVATQLPATAEPDTYWAPNFQYFMDSPTEISAFMLREWPVTDGGRSYTFRLALHHVGTEKDADVFAEKLKRLIPQEMAVWGELPKFDYGTYTFLADDMPQASGDGMEHRNSTYISGNRQLARYDFNQLSAASHEFFHAWNVKRLRPAELEPFDFTRADPTPSLWLAEGFTNYYGPLVIRRSGQSTVDEFLDGMGGTLSFVATTPGRTYGSPQEQSLRAPFVDAAVSIDAVNPNISTSYYAYGQVLALALDLELRQRFKGLTLDAYMRRLWKTHGDPMRPYKASDLRDELAALTGDAAFADGFFKASIEGSALPDYEALLAQAGVKLRRTSPDKPWLGAARVRVDGPEVFLDQAPAPGSALYAAGVERGDRIVSLGRFEVMTEADWKFAIAQLKPGEQAPVRFVQRGRTVDATLTVGADPELQMVRYEAVGLKPTEAQLAFRKAWLGADEARR
jgi:predicted metalloprotease with PDZ domain